MRLAGKMGHFQDNAYTYVDPSTFLSIFYRCVSLCKKSQRAKVLRSLDVRSDQCSVR